MRDSRPKPQIKTSVIVRALFLLFACRFSSFNDFEQQRNRRRLRRFLGRKLPCADELGYVSERFELDSLREVLSHLYATLRRKKILRPRSGLMLANIDGHELRPSYSRCCQKCLQRRVRCGSQEKIQYYHRIVVLHLVGENFEFFFDAEMVEPGEDEIAAALRLIERVLERHPRCFAVLAGDALYLRPSVIDLLTAHGKHLVAVLKENQPELLDEAGRLLPQAEPSTHTFKLPSEKQPRSVELREADGFTTESITTALRIVEARESGKRTRRVGSQRIEEHFRTRWLWATTMPASLLPAASVLLFGHDRWKIENEGFNELVTRWHADHCFHHHPTSILALWLILFIAHAVFRAFYSRNLKPAVRHGRTALYFAKCIEASLRTDNWHPPPT